MLVHLEILVKLFPEIYFPCNNCNNTTNRHFLRFNIHKNAGIPFPEHQATKGTST